MKKNLQQLKDRINFCICDLEDLLVKYHFYFEEKKELQFHCGRRGNVDSVNLMATIRDLFNAGIEPLNSMESNYLSFFSVFAIRQFLEMTGKRIIGYTMIKDADGKPMKKYSQIAWEYLRQDKRFFIFSFDKCELIKIFDWANGFVHTANLYASYVVYFAIQKLESFYPKQAVYKSTYLGGKTWKNCMDIEIYSYKEMKLDFENYLTQKNNGRQINVDWVKPNEISDAYVMSL